MSLHRHHYRFSLAFGLWAVLLTSIALAEIPRSPRQEQAEPSFWLQTRGELRTSYILLKPEKASEQRAVSAGGHVHLKTEWWRGLRVTTTLFVVEDIEPGGTPADSLNPDFFDAQGDGFLIAGEAYLAGRWRDTEVRLGRQALETLHIDGDDLPMLPNLCCAWMVQHQVNSRTSLALGLVDRMAGWENGVDEDTAAAD